MGMGCVGFWVLGRERERETFVAKEGKKNLSPPPLHVHRKKIVNSAIKTTSFAPFIFKE